MTGWGRLRAMGVGIVLLLMVAMPLVKIPGSASAESITFYSDQYLDGELSVFGTSYPPFPPVSTVNASTYNFIGQSKAGPNYVIVRSYLSFNTSTLPSDANILSITLRLRVYADLSSTDFDVRIWQTWLGTELGVEDWNATGSLLGNMFNTAGLSVDSWYSHSLLSSTVNMSGCTEFLLNSSRDWNTAPTGNEMIAIYMGDSASAPELVIDYVSGSGTPILMELDSGAWLNTTMFPEISEWNLTYELYYFAIDTVPLTKNFTVVKAGTNWTFKAVAPLCNYTDSSTETLFWDVYDSICYRVWFTVPKSSPYSTLHISMFNAFTGEGLFWENLKVMISPGATYDNTTAEQVPRPDYPLEPDTVYTLRVMDFFGNGLIDYTVTTSTSEIYANIPVPIYSWQIFNMNDAPVLMRIYWNNSGAPWEFFVGPHWIIERFLKGGNYTFMVTFYESSGVAGSTVYYNRTIPMTGLNASFVYVNGTTLSEIVSSIEGVMAVQQIITNLVSPSMVLIYENLPLAPVQIRTLSMSTRIALDPYLILEATTYQNRTGTALANATLWLPHPNTLGCSYYILADTLTFSGTFLTDIFINQTDGTNLYSNTVLPAAVQLNGENITIWCDNNFQVTRTTVWREISEYTVNYYSTQRKYETTISLNNTSPFDYYSPYWYVAFPQNTTIDQDTVTVYDLDNGITLTQRTNFDVTAGGIHFTLTRLNASDARNFRIVYWDANGSSGIGAPNLIAEAYTQGTLNGISMKYTSVQWMNPYSTSYIGEIYISLNFSEGENLLRNSIVIIDETTGNSIPNAYWVYTGRTILILTDGVGTVPVGGARNYGIYFTLDTTIETPRHDYFFGPIVINGNQFWIGSVAVSWFIITLILMWSIVGWLYWNEKDWMPMLIIVGSISVVGFYFKMMLGG